MVGAGHDGGHVMGVAGFDDLVAVRGHEQIGENGCAARPPEDLHHHRHAGDLSQGLPGQASRPEPRRDHAEDDHDATLPPFSLRQLAGRPPPPRSRGSSTSRSASPSMLKPKTASEMAAPGQMAIHGARYMNDRPEPESMAPQDGKGGGTPKPRKDRADSARMAA